MTKVYYKIQQYSPVSLTWLDIQRRVDTLPEALSQVASDSTKRIMRVDGKHREIVTA